MNIIRLPHRRCPNITKMWSIIGTTMVIHTSQKINSVVATNVGENFSSSTKPANDVAEYDTNTTVKDYWTDHADTHFTDCWEETKGKSHF
mmetsp:Transcript_35836/g.86432  ORF Transcript_35836/g.86432 Transcript_35836/m.86432 type:complete len:90 (+) Transcript_35836:498-767(+)